MSDHGEKMSASRGISGFRGLCKWRCGLVVKHREFNDVIFRARDAGTPITFYCGTQGINHRIIVPANFAGSGLFLPQPRCAWNFQAIAAKGA